MSLHVMEKPIVTNAASEVWCDSSPLVYEPWRQATLAQAPQTKRDDWQARLARLFDPSRGSTGEMGVPQCSACGQAMSQGLARAQAAGSDLAGGDFVDTCPPGFIAQWMQAEDRLPPFDPAAIDREPDAALIARLRQLPYFRQAGDFNGMAPAEFSHFAAFATTATEIAAAPRKTVDFVARAMNGRQTRVA